MELTYDHLHEDEKARSLTVDKDGNILVTGETGTAMPLAPVPSVPLPNLPGFSVQTAAQDTVTLLLKYSPQGESVITQIRRYSKTGARLYRPVGKLPRVLNGLGIAVVSTNQGVLSDRQCRERRISGEVICTVC